MIFGDGEYDRDNLIKQNIPLIANSRAYISRAHSGAWLLVKKRPPMPDTTLR